MHRNPTKRLRNARFSRNLNCLTLLVLACGTLACSPDRPVSDPTVTLAAVEPAERDSAIARISRANTEAFLNAFSHLDAYTYERYLRTEQFNDQDAILAYEQYELRYDASTDTPSVVTSESAGTFDYGMFHDFESNLVDDLENPDLTSFVLPEDPPYLSSREQENFHFRFRPDTLLFDRQAQVIEVRAIPQLGDGQNIRTARYYLDRRTDQVVALSLDRIDLTMLYREESSFFVHIQPTQHGDWVPANTRFETSVRTPFRDPQKFRSVSTFYNYSPLRAKDVNQNNPTADSQ